MEVRDFLLNEIKSGEYRLNTDRSLTEFDGRLKCIYHLQSSFRGKLDRQHLKMRIHLRKMEKRMRKLQKRCRRNYQRELKRRMLLMQMLEELNLAESEETAK